MIQHAIKIVCAISVLMVVHIMWIIYYYFLYPLSSFCALKMTKVQWQTTVRLLVNFYNHTKSDRVQYVPRHLFFWLLPGFVPYQSWCCQWWVWGMFLPRNLYHGRGTRDSGLLECLLITVGRWIGIFHVLNMERYQKLQHFGHLEWCYMCI